MNVAMIGVIMFIIIMAFSAKHYASAKASNERLKKAYREEKK